MTYKEKHPDPGINDYHKQSYSYSNISLNEIKLETKIDESGLCIQVGSFHLFPCSKHTWLLFKAHLVENVACVFNKQEDDCLRHLGKWSK